MLDTQSENRRERAATPTVSALGGKGERRASIIGNKPGFALGCLAMAVSTEWLYGSRSVYAALQAGHRPLHTLYVARRTPDITALAQKRALRVEVVGADRLEQLSKQSKHQGLVLKVQPRGRVK